MTITQTIIQNEMMQNPFGSTSKVALNGSRTTIRWQDVIAQSIVQLNDLWRACAWVTSWVNSVHTMLHYGPLLGHTLTELTEQIAHGTEGSGQTRSRSMEKTAVHRPEVSLSPFRNQEPYEYWPLAPFRQFSSAQSGIDKTSLFRHNFTELTDLSIGKKSLMPEVDLSRQSQSSWAEYRHQLARKQDMAMESDVLAATSPGSDSVTVQQKTQISKKSPDPFQMDRQASQSLLSRLAGNYVSAEGPNRTQYRPIRTISISGKKNSPPISQYMGDHRDWLYNLTLRVESSLHHLEFDALGVPSHTLPAWSLIPEKHLLTGQWQLPLKGQRAHVDLLPLLTSLSEMYMPEFNRGHQLDSHSEVPADHSRDLLTQPQSGLEFEEDKQVSTSSPKTGTQQQHLGLRSEPASFPGQLSFTTHEELHHSPGSQAMVTGRIPGVGRELEAPARIAPPGMAPSLPPLLPSQVVDVPSTPVAAVSALHGAQQEETTGVGDDLSELAAKIKRIMDEEARRYGIDV